MVQALSENKSRVNAAIEPRLNPRQTLEKIMKAKETQEPSEHRAFEFSSFAIPVTHSRKEINERRLAFEQKAIE
jgi:hypothetical protein